MKTDAERMALIRQRTAQLQRQARARQMLLIDAGCMAACLVLVVCLGLAMPGWAGTSVALHVSPTGTAGMLSERGADGYILVGVLSFLLGSCVTILLYRLRRSSAFKIKRLLAAPRIKVCSQGNDYNDQNQHGCHLLFCLCLYYYPEIWHNYGRFFFFIVFYHDIKISNI